MSEPVANVSDVTLARRYKRALIPFRKGDATTILVAGIGLWGVPQALLRLTKGMPGAHLHPAPGGTLASLLWSLAMVTMLVVLQGGAKPSVRAALGAWLVVTVPMIAGDGFGADTAVMSLLMLLTSLHIYRARR